RNLKPRNLTVKLINPSVWSRYKLVGGSQRTCEVSGTGVSWSGDAPVCQRITCDPPPAIPHGTHNGSSRDTFSFGDVVTYSCASGLSLAGDASLSCSSADGQRGSWSGAAPRCQEVRCPAPPSIANGQHGASPGDRHGLGSVVLYTCTEGYSLVGNASIRCTAAGTWSRPQPRCQAIGCTRPEIENGKVAGLETTYSLEDIVVFECNFGYALKGSQESQCKFGGKWDPPVPTCEKRKCRGGAGWELISEPLCGGKGAALKDWKGKTCTYLSFHPHNPHSNPGRGCPGRCGRHLAPSLERFKRHVDVALGHMG
uniref:Uncharacterized protein n=1 Tax=Corvus moneduloides TaxID=1196302 RepID=A0A8U7NM09_CORMO